MQHEIQVGLAFCTPHPKIRNNQGQLRLAPVTIEWHRARSSINMPTNYNTVNVTVDGMEVGDARNAAVDCILGMERKPEFLFFLDYDVIPAWDAVTKLIYRAAHFKEHDILCGVYCSKSIPAEPLIYNAWGRGPYWDWTVGDILTEGIVGVHMGVTLIRTSLLEKMKAGPDKPLFLTQNSVTVTDKGMNTQRGTEDLYFCKRACEEFDAKILVDTSVLCGHIQNETGMIFGLPSDCGPVKRARWMDKGEEYVGSKKALDIGAGATRRKWEDHQTFTTDIRPDVGADYVQDTRKLNLPSDHFDLVASSHHLEHIPRFEQEGVWSEIFRITKPGGRIEHIVPSMDWAGHKIFNGDVDEHVMNVAYGAQEAHSYERLYNLHYFGYTKGIAQALAEQAGFTDVSLEDWRANPDHGYNLIIRGVKPQAA